MDLAEAFFTANPDDTVLSSEITLENHILLAYLDGKSHVHWILHYQNDPQAEDNNPVIPALPIFNSDPDFCTARCPDSDVTPIVRIPWGERNINYFRYNLYALSADKVLSYERLLTNLGNDLPNQNLDLAAMEFVDVGRGMRVRNQRTLLNYYDLAIGHETPNFVWSLVRKKQPQRDSDRNASAAGPVPDLTAVPVGSTLVSSSTSALPLSVTIVPQIPTTSTVAPPQGLSPVIQQLSLPQVPAHSWQPVGESSRMGAVGHFGLPSLVHTMYSSLGPQRNTAAPGHSADLRPTLPAVGPSSTASPSLPAAGTQEYTSRDTYATSTRSSLALPAPQPASTIEFALPSPQTRQPASPASPRGDTSCPSPPRSPPTLSAAPASSPACPTTALSSTAFPSSPPITFPIIRTASAPSCPAPLLVSTTLPPSPTAALATHSDPRASCPPLMAIPVTSPTHLTSIGGSTATMSSHRKVPRALGTPLPISLTLRSPPLASLASSQGTSPSPLGLVPTPTPSPRPHVSASSKSYLPSTNKKETESNLAAPVTITSSGKNRPSTDCEVSTNTNNKFSLTKFKLPIINISDDDHDDNDHTIINKDHNQHLDQDSDISTVTGKDSDDDNDFEMTDYIDDEESGETDSHETSAGWKYEKELDEINEDQAWRSEKDTNVCRQEEDRSQEDNTAKEAEAEQGEEQEQEEQEQEQEEQKQEVEVEQVEQVEQVEVEEEDLDPQPATKRRLAAPSSKATHKRAKLAIPTSSSAVGRPQRRNPGENISQDMYLVSTVTQPLQASLAATDSFSPANQSLSVEDR